MTVGGGTGGSVLASRLAEDGERTVLVLEAGPDPSNKPDVDVPIYADRLIGSEFDWQFESTPQKTCCKSHKDGVSNISTICSVSIVSKVSTISKVNIISNAKYMKGN